MGLTLIILFEILYAISVLIIISAGLAIIFGMMRVINLAHGEFIILGSYTAITAQSWGINHFLSILVIAPVTVGIFGLIIERLIIRHLYGRLINTMLATWGLSLIMIGMFKVIFGNVTTGISQPLGSYTLAGYQLSGYNLFVVLIALLSVICIWFVLKVTQVGLIARATMQNAEIAACFGFDVRKIYMATFTAGAFFAGLAGGIMAPLFGVHPGGGANFIAKSFITVITGGSSVVTGLLSSATLLGFISQLLSFLTTPVIGEVTLLSVAIVLLVALPIGISGRFFRNHI